MKSYGEHLRILSLRLLAVFAVYTLCRFTFFLLNYSYFSNSPTGLIGYAFIAGWRFDLSAIAFTNALVILLHIIPWKFFFSNGYQKLTMVVYYICNLPALFANCIDLEYFKYQGKRTTADLFAMVAVGDDIGNTLISMVVDFWYVLLIFGLTVAVLVLLNKKIKQRSTFPVKYNFKSLIAIVLIIGTTVIAARGGLQYKPLGLMSAAGHVPQRLVPLTLNTGFTIIRTLGKTTLEEKHYMTDAETKSIFNPEKRYNGTEAFTGKNVVLIILESFSCEYIGYYNHGKGYTPVLDSLIRTGLVCDYSFANAKRSIDGIPAVTAALPTLMPFSFITGNYNTNHLESLGGLLARKGYTSGFYHGGNNGTMGFDNFTHITGFDHYYGRNEYGNKDYDGNWGIYDGNFFNYFLESCNKSKAPFANVIFSLSSHHPYAIPPALQDKFPEGPMPIHKSIGYADYVLGQFFKAAQQQSWYNNTLFVITADHTGPNHDPKYNSTVGMYRVPLLFIAGDGSLRGNLSKTVQQTDIVPSILSYLHYDLPYVAFGDNVFDTAIPGRAINFTGNLYQIFNDSLLLQFDGEAVTGLYKFKTDPVLRQNLMDKMPGAADDLEAYGKSFIQQFNDAMINNKLVP